MRLKILWNNLGKAELCGRRFSQHLKWEREIMGVLDNKQGNQGSNFSMGESCLPCEKVGGSMQRMNVPCALSGCELTQGSCVWSLCIQQKFIQGNCTSSSAWASLETTSGFAQCNNLQSLYPENWYYIFLTLNKKNVYSLLTGAQQCECMSSNKLFSLL